LDRFHLFGRFTPAVGSRETLDDYHKGAGKTRCIATFEARQAFRVAVSGIQQWPVMHKVLPESTSCLPQFAF